MSRITITGVLEDNGIVLAPSSRGLVKIEQCHPHELIAWALAKCTLTTILSNAQWNLIPLKTATVQVDFKGNRTLKKEVFKVSIIVPGHLNEYQIAKLKKAANKSTIRNTLLGNSIVEHKIEEQAKEPFKVGWKFF